MKTVAVVLLALVGFVPPAFANGTGKAGASAPARTIYVSCYRGPWAEVIWDRPNAEFIDSLVRVGYDYPTASAIGERICRDQALVGNAEGMKSEMIRVFNESPKYRNPKLRIRSN